MQRRRGPSEEWCRPTAQLEPQELRGLLHTARTAPDEVELEIVTADAPTVIVDRAATESAVPIEASMMVADASVPIEIDATMIVKDAPVPVVVGTPVVTTRRPTTAAAPRAPVYPDYPGNAWPLRLRLGVCVCVTLGVVGYLVF
jgi:hypothetical protein